MTSVGTGVTPYSRIGSDLRTRRTSLAFVVLSGCLLAATAFGLVTRRRSEVLMARLPSASKYQRAQLHGFEVFTLPGNSHDGCTRHAQFDASDERCYLGHEDVGEDAKARTDLMIAAVDAAHASARSNASADVLHVFLAPEFFFRGQAGAYLTDDLVSSRVACVEPLFRHVQTEKFADWLFVFGTVIAASPPNTSFSPKTFVGPPAEAHEWAFYNFAPVVKGGANAQGWLTFKNYVSGLDFLRFDEPQGERRRDEAAQARAGIGSGASDRYRYSRTPPAVHKLLEPYPNWKVLDDHEMVIETDGLRVGVEICVDHLSDPDHQDLRQQLEEMGRSRGLPHGEPLQIDLQLVVSAGMHLSDGPVLTRPGSPAFLVDGYSRTEVSLNAWGRGGEEVGDAATDGANEWFDELGPGFGAYDVGTVAYHDSSMRLHASLNGISSAILKRDYERWWLNAFYPPPGWNEAYVPAIDLSPVVDLSNATERDAFAQLFLLAPYEANTKVFTTLVEALSFRLGIDTDRLYALIEERVGTRAGDFGPAVATYPPVAMRGAQPPTATH